MIAALVAILPGGGTGASVVVTGLSLVFLGALVWVAAIMYREHRGSLYLLGDGKRALLYSAAGVLAVTLTATNKLWSSPRGEIAWLALVGGVGLRRLRHHLGRPALLTAVRRGPPRAPAPA